MQKVIQYSMRLYLLFHNSIASSAFFRNNKRRPWEDELIKRLESAIAGFSLTRYVLAHEWDAQRALCH